MGTLPRWSGSLLASRLLGNGADRGPPWPALPAWPGPGKSDRSVGSVGSVGSVILIAGAALIVASVSIFGGRFRRLVEIEIRDRSLILVALALQTIAISVLDRRLSAIWAGALHVTSYGCAAGFLLANRRLRGLWVTGLGGVLNLAPILANGGVMPATAAAVQHAGLPVAEGFANSQPLHDPHLAMLGDIFALPARLPLANVFSLGDVALGIGLVVVLHHATGSRLLPARGSPTEAGTQA